MKLAAIAALTVLCGHAQEFEVATIKDAAPMAAGMVRIGGGGGPGTSDPGKVSYVNMSLRDLLVIAYGVKREEITGPEIIDSEHFDLTAKVPLGATKEQLPVMLRKLLEQRFNMVAHKETKQLPVYVMTVAKSGVKMATSKGDTAPKVGFVKMYVTAGRMSLTGTAMDLPELLRLLTGFAGRPVSDKTGLKDRYDFTLSFAPEPGTMRIGGALMPVPPGGRGAASTESVEPAPSLFTAVQDQLGLKLDADKGPVEIVIVDKIDKKPSEN